MSDYSIIVLPGDGIGPEVMRETVKVLKGVTAGLPELKLDFLEHPISVGHYENTGEILPDYFVEECKKADAILLAAIGLPDVCLPDGTEVQPHIIVDLRKALDLYAAVRPIKLFKGAPSPLKDTGPGIDLIILRENTEGLFASFGGGSVVDNQVVTDTMVITRAGTERIVEFAFQLAEQRNGRPMDGKRTVTCVDKANVFRSLAFFRNVFNEVAARYPQIASESAYVDAMSLYLVQNPSEYDVLVMENMFGDILSDLGAGLVGGLGLGPSAEIGDQYAMFQPSHGSAPQIGGQNIANPIATILSGAMMLDWLGKSHNDKAAIEAGKIIESAVETVLINGKILTPDLGGRATTEDVGNEILRIIESGEVTK